MGKDFYWYIDKQRNTLVIIENWIYSYYCITCGQKLNYDFTTKQDGFLTATETGYYEREVKGKCKKCNSICSYTG